MLRFHGKKIICAGLLTATLAFFWQPVLPRAEAGFMGSLLKGAIAVSFKNSLEPQTIEADYNAMRNNYIQAIILQHEACQEYLALAEGREYQQEVDRVGVMKAYLRDNVVPSHLLTGGINPQFLQQDLEKLSRQKDYLTPAMQLKIQGIADKRRAAHTYSSQANKLLLKLTGATIAAMLDRDMAQDEKIIRAGQYLQMAIEAADFMQRSHAYSKQTKKFLQPWEEKVGVEERSKKKLLQKYDLQPDSVDLSVTTASRFSMPEPVSDEAEADEEL